MNPLSALFWVIFIVLAITTVASLQDDDAAVSTAVFAACAGFSLAYAIETRS